MNRWGNSKEVSNLIVFLISDESKYITGQNIFIDGGWTANENCWLNTVKIKFI